MQIRIVKETELWNVLNFSAQMFWKQDLGRYTEEGKERFLEFLKYENQLAKFKAGEILLFAAFDREKICAAMELDLYGKILFFYTDEEKKAFRMLEQCLAEACRFAAGTGMHKYLRLEAIPEKESMYFHAGFVPYGEKVWTDGMQMQPMELSVEEKLRKPAEKKSGVGLYLGIGIGAVIVTGVLLFTLFLSAFVKSDDFQETMQEQIEQIFPGEDSEEPDDGGKNEEPDDGGENDGIKSVDAYIDPHAGYKVQGQHTEYQSDQKSKFFVAYDIKYPEVSGISGKAGRKINEQLKACAMETIDGYYEHPTEKIKEWMLFQPHAMVASQVDYVVSYQDKNLLSAAFEDIYAAGDYNASYIGLRSLVINVKDGTVYDISDVLTLDYHFAQTWMAEVFEEYPGNEFANAFGVDEIEAFFHGEGAEDGIRPVMLLTAEGIEIGFEYRLQGGNSADRTGYLTVVFEKEDLKACQKNPDFWKMIKND